MKKLLTFDCYGTLVDTGSFAREVAAIGQEHGLDGERVGALYFLNEARLMYAEPFLPLDALIGEALRRCDVIMGADFMEREQARLVSAQSALQPFPEVVETLRELRRRGYGVVILSNSCHSIMAHNLSALEHQADELILAEDVQAYKPQLSFFRQAEQRLGLLQQEHCHIAQGYFEDIVPGSRVGWNRIWVNRNHERGQACFRPEAEVSTLDELLPLFQ